MIAASARARAWRHRQHALVCDRIEPWQHGTLVRAGRWPTYYDYNLVRVEGPDPGLDAKALAAAADAPLAGLGHRRIDVEDEQAGRRLRPQFERMGWIAERLAFMHRELPGPEVRAPAGAELRIDDFAATRALRGAWRGESIWQEGPAFDLVEEAVAAPRGTRAALALLDREPAAFAAFSSGDGTVEIELVFCLRRLRGGGLGGAVVARALAEAAAGGARDALIEADDDGAAQRLYERLGFRTAWVRHVFTKMPSGGDQEKRRRPPA